MGQGHGETGVMANTGADAHVFLAGGGECAALIAARDWSRTPLGPITGWPQSLKTATAILLRSPVPMVMLWGVEGIMLYNDAYSVFAGGRHPQLLGSPVREGWPEVADFNDHVMKVVLAGGTLAYKDQELTLYRHGAAEQVFMNLDYSPVLDESGKPAGVLAIVVETTEAVLTQRRLRESEAQARLNAERIQLAHEAGAIIGTWFWHLPSDRFSVDEQFALAFGIDPTLGREGLSLEQVIANVHPDDRDGLIAAIDAAIARGGRYAHQYRVRRDDGRYYWIEANGRVDHDVDGTPLYFPGVLLDVEDRRRNEDERQARALAEAAEAARRQADAMYRAYFENTAEALFVVGVDPDGGLTLEELNPAHEAATGLSTETIRGKPLHAQLPEPAASAVAANYRRAIAARHPISYREVLDFPAGVRHWDTVLVPVIEPDGSIRRIIGSARDVTARVRAEEALRQAQKMEAVGQLTGGIAHDFNNLLAAIMGNFDLIRRRPDSSERVQRWAENGMTIAERGAKLTGQLLAFSRAQRIELKPVLVQSVIETLRPMLERALGPMIRLHVDLNGARLAVMSDPTQLEMAVLNLAINARDAMPEGGEVTVAIRPLVIDDDPELKGGEYVELEVRDDGAGMPPETLARAFDPFFTTKGVGKGTGLGLSQVYGIARQAGGIARISSAPGKGTTVRLILPRSETVPDGEADQVHEAADAAARPATVLVIDDDNDLRHVLIDALEALGYRAEQAADGPSGLAAIERVRPDLVVLDFAMPGMNGAEVARAAWERWPELPIVFASGYSDTAAIERVAGAGATLVRKPFRIEELQNVLTGALAARR